MNKTLESDSENEKEDDFLQLGPVESIWNSGPLQFFEHFHPHILRSWTARPKGRPNIEALKEMHSKLDILMATNSTENAALNFIEDLKSSKRLVSAANEQDLLNVIKLSKFFVGLHLPFYAAVDWNKCGFCPFSQNSSKLFEEITFHGISECNASFLMKPEVLVNHLLNHHKECGGQLGQMLVTLLKSLYMTFPPCKMEVDSSECYGF